MLDHAWLLAQSFLIQWTLSYFVKHLGDFAGCCPPFQSRRSWPYLMLLAKQSKQL